MGENGLYNTQKRAAMLSIASVSVKGMDGKQKRKKKRTEEESA
jgi:hypothetical protein